VGGAEVPFNNSPYAISPGTRPNSESKQAVFFASLAGSPSRSTRSVRGLPLCGVRDTPKGHIPLRKNTFGDNDARRLAVALQTEIFLWHHMILKDLWR
jgi:hypothetical protein